MKTLFKLQGITSALIIGLLGHSPAGAISIADTPLFIGATVDPNVMLLVDTSGSMDNIIWADGYDNTVIYPDWSNGDDSYKTSSGNNHLHSIKRGSCSSGWKHGHDPDTGATKCLRLPDPVGSSHTRYSGNYLNYLFETYANGTDLRAGQIPGETRMQVAKTAAKDLVAQTTGVRFGTSSFYGPSSQSWGHGATIDAVCGSSNATLNSAIDGYSASTNTPLAEALYEVTRYFRGMSSFYHDNLNYTSPIQYRCQHNFSVVITDGLPTRDTTFATNDPDAPSGSLPNWDGLSPTTTTGMYPNFPQYSDGFQPSGSQGDEGYSLYLDDIAKFGYDTDFKTSGTDNAGGSYQDPNFPTQSMETYTIGFAQNNQMLEDAAEYGNGLYFTANDASDLADALKNAIDDAKFKGQAAAAAVATNSTRLDANTTIYQARFDSRDWSGDLLAFSLNEDTGDVNTTPDWSAQALIPAAAGRNIVTYDTVNNAGIPFQWPGDYTSLTSGTDFNSVMVQGLLGNAPFAWDTSVAAEQTANQTYGAELVAYLRGDTSNNGTYNPAFRSRNTVLGDIVNSNPAFVGTRDFGFKLIPGAEGDEYTTFRNTSAYKDRATMLYVGANDGMLHAFNADTGTELFAYVPSTVYPNLDALADVNYAHQYYVNGSPRSSDAYLSGAWKTVLVGAPGAGGRSVFALDITSPAGFSESRVLWEFTSADDADLGFVLGQPTIARMNDGSWVALVANGYNSANDRAVLYIINLDDGTLLKKIDTEVGSSGNPNGLSALVPVDTDGDRITDTIYAGDLQGNMWKFDVSASNTNSWDVAFKEGGPPQPAPLFTALDAGGTAQAITVRPAVGIHPEGGIMVYFGTGKFFEVGDNIIPATPQVNTFYAIRDTDATVSGRGELQAQTIDYELYAQTFGTDVFDVRVVSDNSVDYVTMKGWYLDLVSPVNGMEGERVVVEPLLRNGRIIFSTLIPALDPCGFGGSGWLMEIDAINGARFTYSVFDLNGDGLFDEQDYATLPDGSKVPVSGLRFNEIISQPKVIEAGEKEYKYISGSSGDISTVTEKSDPTKGRQSWRQIR